MKNLKIEKSGKSIFDLGSNNWLEQNSVRNRKRNHEITETLIVKIKRKLFPQLILHSFFLGHPVQYWELDLHGFFLKLRSSVNIHETTFFSRHLTTLSKLSVTQEDAAVRTRQSWSTYKHAPMIKHDWWRTEVWKLTNIHIFRKYCLPWLIFSFWLILSKQNKLSIH